MTTRVITSVTPTPPWHGLPTLPSLENLVAVAAQISSSDEDPAETALRALCLFNECRTVLIRARKAAAKVRMEEYRASEIREMDRKFIESLESYDGDRSGAVTLDSFLKACRPTAKPDVLLEKWRAFIREFENLHNEMDSWRGHPRKSDEKISTEVEKLFRNDREKGIGRKEIIAARDLFLDWLEIDLVQSKKTKAAKSKNARKYLPVCRRVLKKTLSDSDNDVLKEMGDAELASAIKTLRSKNELGQNGAGLLKAAIEDASRPKNAKPRLSTKKPET